jgi:hypothetical protein
MSIWQAIGGFEGRIARASAWPALLGLPAASIAVFAAAYVMLGGTWDSAQYSTLLAPKPTAAAFPISGPNTYGPGPLGGAPEAGAT